MNKKINGKYINTVALFLIFLSSLTILKTLGNNLYSFWDHILPPFNSQLSIIRDLYVWDFNLVGGRYFVYLPHLEYHLLVYLLNYLFSINIANTLIFWFLFFISGISMYFFTKSSLTKRFTSKSKIFIGLVSALVYMYNPYWILRITRAPLIMFIIAFLPLEFLLVRKALLNADISMKNTFKYISLAALISILMTSGLAELAAGLSTGFLIVLYLFFLSISKQKIKSFIKVLPLMLFFTLLVHFWWIGPNLLHKSVGESINKKGQYTSDAINSLKLGSEDTKYFNVLRVNGYFNEPSIGDLSGYPLRIDYSNSIKYNNFLFILISLVIPIISIISFFSRKVKTNSDSIVFFLCGMIIIPLFLVGYNPPFSNLIIWMVKNIPFFVFRRPSLYIFLLHFIYAYIFSLGIYTIYIKIIKFKKPLNHIFFGLIFSLLIIAIGLNSYPQWLGYTLQISLYDEAGRSIPVSVLTKTPKYVEEVKNYLNKNSDGKGVLILPKIGSVRGYNWENGYFGFDIYYLLLNNPILTVYRYNRLQPSDSIYSLIDTMINGNEYENFINILTLLNIKYIILQQDSLRWGKETFNLNRINKFLANNDKVRLIKKFGNHTIYDIEGNSDIFRIYTKSRIGSDILNSNDLDTLNNIINSELNRADLINTATIRKSITLNLENHISPNMTINQLNNTTFNLQISNAKTPFIITSSFFYDDGWQAFSKDKYFSNTIINGVFNGWVIDKTGNFIITVTYSKQKKAILMAYLSIFSLILIIIINIYMRIFNKN